MDLMLPGLSGEEVLPHIENIPVIVISAKEDVQDKVNLLMSGAADYMTKPFDTTLGLSIAKVLTERMRGSISEQYQNERLYVRLEFGECLSDG